jgi:pyridoxamine 5'-phosphate oxidase
MSHTELLPDPLPTEPLTVAAGWLAESFQLGRQPNPNAMALATVEQDRPSARVVLCKGIVPQPGYLVFYTNYLSRKGRELTRTARAAAVLHWDHLHRQVRVEGPVTIASAADSDAYFKSRPWQSRLGAWASAQSEPVASRRQLRSALEAAAHRFGTPIPDETAELSQSSPTGIANPIDIPRPPHWGGYLLWAEQVELWVEGEARIHDRARWVRSLTACPDGFVPGPWSSTRLQP